MGISEAVRILSDGARQVIQGVAVTAAAPFSFDCDVFVKFVGGMTSRIGHGEN